MVSMTLALGAHTFGSEPLAGDPLHDPVSVAVVAPGSITDGGPTVTFEWDFSQPQGDTQEWYRVRVTNDAMDETYYDSGFLAGDVSSFEVDFDQFEIPAETDDITVVVDVRGPESIGTGEKARYEASSSQPFEIHWGNPHATIVRPANGEIVSASSGLDIEWTFSDDDGGNTQGAYRVRVLLKDTGLVIWDTGWTPSSATSIELPIVLQDQWTYQIEVQLRNNHGLRSD